MVTSGGEPTKGTVRTLAMNETGCSTDLEVPTGAVATLCLTYNQVTGSLFLLLNTRTYMTHTIDKNRPIDRECNFFKLNKRNTLAINENRRNYNDSIIQDTL